MPTPREILANAYNNAGREFLAYRLTHVFAKIENQEDVALHNNVMQEIDTIVDKNSSELMKEIADLILKFSRKD